MERRMNNSGESSDRSISGKSNSRVLRICILAGRAFFLSSVVVASLLTFPSALPWMIAAWLAGHTVLVVWGRPGWIPLAVCMAVVLAKRTPWMPGVVAMLVVMVAAATFRMILQRKTHLKWVPYASRLTVVAIWIAWAAMLADWRAATRCSRPATLVPDRPVICLGDSLTASTADWGYPTFLKEMINIPVVDRSVPGLTTKTALSSLPALKKSNPQVVVIELGGNDFVDGAKKDVVKANLEQIIRTCREIGADVVLVEIPRGFMFDPFGGIERELARRHDLELIADTPIRRLVLSSPTTPPGMWTGGPYLSEDGIHPNQNGSRLLAEYVAETLVRMYGSGILIQKE